MKWLITIILTALLILALMSPVQAENKYSWDSTDTALQVTYTALHVMDWAQSLHVARNNPHCYGVHCLENHSESNPILGDHPSEGQVNTYFASTLVLHTMISYILPKPYRTIWQGVWIGIEQDSVRHNIGAGIRLHF